MVVQQRESSALGEYMPVDQKVSASCRGWRTSVDLSMLFWETGFGLALQSPCVSNGVVVLTQSMPTSKQSPSVASCLASAGQKHSANLRHMKFFVWLARPDYHYNIYLLLLSKPNCCPC